MASIDSIITTLVQSDIIESLFLVDPVIVSCDLNRKNVYISASPIKSLDVGEVGHRCEKYGETYFFTGGLMWNSRYVEVQQWLHHSQNDCICAD